MTISTLFIANRGEIARRITRTARSMGIDTVVPYADPDVGAPFVREADRAVPLHGSTSAETYLDSAKLIAAARLAGADAVHPGYGFLAENAGFAAAVQEAGLTWVGPNARAIAVMGDKLTALVAMESAGVPTLPRANVNVNVNGDSDGDGDSQGTDSGRLLGAAAQVGYPVMVKASAGGGGKGMRIVAERADLLAAVAAARRESASAFGNDTVFLERFVPGGRHIEVQVLGDAQGNVRHLYERECSIQRRHQKIVEESPSPFVGPELRKSMCEAAVAAAEAVGYVGAGTVEFIVGQDGAYYFLEMNTRLQVEHPVTELVTGIDLVRQQLLIAQGEPAELPDEIPLTGSAIEVRVYAEDPGHDFLPQTGTIVEWAEPDGVRIDAGVETGSVVSPYFDPMLAKVIAHGPTRGETARRLRRALGRLRVRGVRTNLGLLISILGHEAFLAGDTTTDFIDRYRPARARAVPDARLRAAALSAALADRARSQAGRPASRPVPRSLPPGYRNVRSQGRAARYVAVELAEEREIETCYWAERDGSVTATVDGQSMHARVHGWSPPSLSVELDGVRETHSVVFGAGRVWVGGPGFEVEFAVVPRFPDRGEQAVEGGLTAPMNGTVAALEVSPGERVRKGQAIVVIEAMKMEHRVTAPCDGVVDQVLIRPGAVVAAGQVVAIVTPAAADDRAGGEDGAGGGDRDPGNTRRTPDEPA
jgi:propionyl-CoA carboxylase alpha chain